MLYRFLLTRAPACSQGEIKIFELLFNYIKEQVKKVMEDLTASQGFKELLRAKIKVDLTTRSKYFKNSVQIMKEIYESITGSEVNDSVWELLATKIEDQTIKYKNHQYLGNLFIRQVIVSCKDEFGTPCSTWPPGTRKWRCSTT